MTSTDIGLEVDWTACELIERVPGKVSGRPVVRGTRILPDAILHSFELGDTVAEIHDGFPTLSTAQIEHLIHFGLDQLRQHKDRQFVDCGTFTGKKLPEA